METLLSQASVQAAIEALEAATRLVGGMLKAGPTDAIYGEVRRNAARQLAKFESALEEFREVERQCSKQNPGPQKN